MDGKKGEINLCTAEHGIPIPPPPLAAEGYSTPLPVLMAERGQAGFKNSYSFHMDPYAT